MKAVPGAVIELTGGTEPWTKFTALRGPLEACAGYVKNWLPSDLAKRINY